MTQAARKPPTASTGQPSSVARKTGRPTTNQASRAPNKAKRAAANWLMAPAGTVTDSRVNYGLWAVMVPPWLVTRLARVLRG